MGEYKWSDLCPAMRGYWDYPDCGECWGCKRQYEEAGDD